MFRVSSKSLATSGVQPPQAGLGGCPPDVPRDSEGNLKIKNKKLPAGINSERSKTVPPRGAILEHSEIHPARAISERSELFLRGSIQNVLKSVSEGNGFRTF